MYGHPLAGSDLSLINDGAKGGGEPAAQAGRCRKVQPFGSADQIDVGKMDGYIFGERSPVGKARLELVVADLMIARMTLRASTAAADEGHCDPVSGPPADNVLANCHDMARQLMPRNMRQSYVRVMPLPPMPIAAA